MATELNFKDINKTSSPQIDLSITDNCGIIDRNTTITWDNPNTLISLETVKKIDLIRSAIVMPILYFIGCPGNIVSMVVFFKQGLRERINLSLFLLALVDVIFSTFLFIFYAERMRGFTTNHSLEPPPFVVFMVNNNFLGLYGFYQASAFISTVIATERCVCVLFPLRARKCIPTKIFGIMIVTGVCVIAFLRFIVSAKHRIGCFYNVRTGHISWHATASKYYFQNREMINILDGIFYGFCLAVGCPVIVLITTIITAIKLQQTIRWRHRSSSSMSNKEIGVTKMLIWLSVEFFILSVPFIILRIIPIFASEFNIGGQYENTFKLVVICRDLSSYISSCVNFFVYYFTGSKYRETLHRLIGLKSSSLQSKEQQLQEKNMNG